MATTIPVPLQLEGWVSFLRAHAAITRELSAQLQREHDLTLNDYEVLLHLSHAEDGRMRRVDLAQQVVLTASGITRLLEGLERCGLRRQGDLRVRRARLVREADRRGPRQAALGRRDAPARDRRALRVALLGLGAGDARRAPRPAARHRGGLQDASSESSPVQLSG